MSQISSPLPTTCFTDTILLPLPTYIFLVFLGSSSLAALLLKRNTSSSQLQFTTPSTENRRWYSFSSSRTANGQKRSKVQIAAVVLYYIFLLANLLLSILEMARLSTIHFGVALLPFVTVGILLAGILHHFRGFNGSIPGYAYFLIVFWVANMVMSIIKTAGLAMEGVHGRKGSMYPLEDQLTDTGVMAGVYLLIAGLEVLLWHWDVRRDGEGEKLAREGSLGSGTTALEDGMGRASSSREEK